MSPQAERLLGYALKQGGSVQVAGVAERAPVRELLDAGCATFRGQGLTKSDYGDSGLIGFVTLTTKGHMEAQGVAR